MRALRKLGPGPGLELVEVPVPEVGPDDVLIEVRAASICGTDLHIEAWDPWAAEHVATPVTVGHELTGVVVARGENVAEPQVGSLVSAESHVVCHVCPWCRTCRGHLCPNAEILGVHRDGAFADYVVIPAENAWPDPPDMPLSVAALQENFGNAVHTVSVPRIAGRKVLVTGAGPVGLMAIATAKALGARSVYVTDLSDYRLELASKMGADLVLDPGRDDVEGVILAATGGEGVDVLLEMSGAPAAITTGFRVLKPGGEAALLGLTSGPIEFDLDDSVIFKGATVHGIVGRRLWETWLEMRGLIRSGAVDLAPVVTHRFALEDYAAAFDLMRSGRCGKVVLFPDPAHADGPLTDPAHLRREET
ncbi:MAG TPA: L-threonine 3-dehydrogenase [Actinobacteria bacterium]|nr:L-threonine 3-dehydrogenase [Actinomycetota bacterium]